MRCLIIDDNPDDRSLVERIIRGTGHRATSVASGDDAVALLEHERFDVAVVDLRMTGMSGFDTLRELRARDPSLRLLVVSGYGDKGHIMAAVEAGADGYILKDDMSDEMGRALQDLRAGMSPLSGRVGRVLLAQVKRRLESEPPTPEPEVVRPKKLADASGEIILGKVKLTGDKPA